MGASEAIPPVTRASHLIAPRKSRFSSACYLRHNIQILKGSVTFSSIFFSNLAYTHLPAGVVETLFSYKLILIQIIIK